MLVMCIRFRMEMEITSYKNEKKISKWNHIVHNWIQGIQKRNVLTNTSVEYINKTTTSTLIEREIRWSSFYPHTRIEFLIWSLFSVKMVNLLSICGTSNLLHSQLNQTKPYMEAIAVGITKNENYLKFPEDFLRHARSLTQIDTHTSLTDIKKR